MGHWRKSNKLNGQMEYVSGRSNRRKGGGGNQARSQQQPHLKRGWRVHSSSCNMSSTCWQFNPTYCQCINNQTGEIQNAPQLGDCGNCYGDSEANAYNMCTNYCSSLSLSSPGGNNGAPTGYYPNCPNYVSCRDSGGTLNQDCQCSHYAQTRSTRSGTNRRGRNRRITPRHVNNRFTKPGNIAHWQGGSGGGQSVHHWIIDCGPNSSSEQFTCSEADNAGWVDGGEIIPGCVTVNVNCHQPA